MKKLFMQFVIILIVVLIGIIYERVVLGDSYTNIPINLRCIHMALYFYSGVLFYFLTTKIK